MLSDDAVAALRHVSTATLTVQLARRGIQTTFLDRAAARRARTCGMVGYAHTLRYVPLREDVRDADAGRADDAQKRAVESIGPGEVLVIEARGEHRRGHDRRHPRRPRRWRAAAPGSSPTAACATRPASPSWSIPTYYRVANASSLWNAHIPLDIDVPITCAGVLVMPGDVIVGDAEGVVVLPAALAEEVALDALEREQREAFALERVKAGESVRGLYPLSEARRADYEAWRRNAKRGASAHEQPVRRATPSAVRGAITPLDHAVHRRRRARPRDDRRGWSTGSSSTARTASRSAGRPASRPRRRSPSGSR